MTVLGSAVGQEFGLRPRIAQARVKSQASPCGICEGQIAVGSVFSAPTWERTELYIYVYISQLPVIVPWTSRTLKIEPKHCTGAAGSSSQHNPHSIRQHALKSVSASGTSLQLALISPRHVACFPTSVFLCWLHLSSFDSLSCFAFTVLSTGRAFTLTCYSLIFVLSLQSVSKIERAFLACRVIICGF